MSDQSSAAAAEPTSSVRYAAEIVSAFVSKNAVPTGEIPDLISSVHRAVARLGSKVEAPAKQPAVPIKKSITPDFLICLEDGKKFRSLRRHLSAVYGMTPDEYRTKWGLPADYPMVAPSYSEKRSALAKASGLGVVQRAAAKTVGPKPELAKVEPASEPKRRGRARKAA